MELEKLLSCWCCMLDPNQQPTRREAAAAVPTGPGAGSGQSVFDVETLDDTKDIYAVDLSERTGPEFTFLIEEASIGDEATPRPRESMWLRKNSLAVIETVRGKTGLQQLMLEFVKTAQPIAEVLVREAFLAPQERTLEPYGSGQQPLSDKRFVVDGIMFSFALARTGEKRRGTMRDETAMKAALQELRGLAHWSLASVAAASSGDAPIFFPLMAAFDLRGLRVVATSVISVESGNAPLWGSVDGGHTFAGDGPQLAAYVEKIGRLLNLKGAFVGSGAEQGPEKRLTHAPADMQIRRGLDGRFYMLGLSRLFPPESPHAPPGFDPVDSIMTRQLRPELVRQQPYPLAPDAFTAYLHPEERRRANEDVNRATERLLNQVIPELARRLDAQLAPSALTSMGQDVAFSAENQRLVHMLHEQGICVRHLGTLYRCAKVRLFPAPRRPTAAPPRYRGPASRGRCSGRVCLVSGSAPLCPVPPRALAPSLHPSSLSPAPEREPSSLTWLRAAPQNDMRARLREAGTSDEAALARIALAELNRCGSCDEAEWKRVRARLSLRPLLREGVKRKFRLDAIPALDEYGAFVLTMKRTGYLVFRRVQGCDAALSGAVLPSSGPRAQTILADLARRLGAVPSPGPHGHSSFHPPSRPTAAQVFAAAPNGPSEILNAADFTTISRAYAPPSSVLYAAPRPGDDPAVRPALPAPVLIRNGAPITGAGPSFFAPGEASPGGATPRTSNGAGQGPGQGSGPGLHPAASFSASSAGGGTWGPASGSPSQATPSGGLRATGSFGRPLGRGEVNGPKMWADLVAGKAFLTPDDVNAPLTTPGLEIACWGHVRRTGLDRIGLG
eukprot:tig00021036_g17276.t1